MKKVISQVAWKVGVHSMPSAALCLATWSANSFPKFPVCAATLTRVTGAVWSDTIYQSTLHS